MNHVDLIIHHAAQVVTCANNSQPKRGPQMQDVGIIPNGAIAIQDGHIVAVDNSDTLLRDFRADQMIDASGKTIIPGLVDCHTHTIHAGNRYDEFELRVGGKTYMEIMQAGGGIMNTVRATRAASLSELILLGEQRLADMRKLGTTTVEIKTGYGLSVEAENKMMAAILSLAATQPMIIVPTFLGPHTKPPEYATNADYLATILDNGLSDIVEAYQKSNCHAENCSLFADIFVEDGVFSPTDMVAYFEAADREGFRLKGHLDQFKNLGAVPTAIQMGAISVDHLEVTPPHELDILAASDTIGVMLPTVNFNLGAKEFGNARHLIDANGILALATDFNPGSSPTLSLPMVMAVACRYQKLLPAEALNACTINAAAALQLADRVGSLEVGKRADIVILNSNDYRSMIVEFGRNFVQQVFIKGENVWTAS